MKNFYRPAMVAVLATSAVLMIFGTSMAVASGATSSEPTSSTPASQPMAAPATLQSASPDKPEASTSAETVAGTWRVVSVGDNEMQITIRILVGGSCEKLDHIEVTETASSVTITPIIQTSLAKVCTDQFETQENTLNLSVPLGSRELIHGELS